MKILAIIGLLIVLFIDKIVGLVSPFLKDGEPQYVRKEWFKLFK